MAESRSISSDGNFAQACLKGISPAAINLDFVMVGMQPSLVLKSKNTKSCVEQTEMSSLSNMIHESRLCSKIVMNIGTHMI